MTHCEPCNRCQLPPCPGWWAPGRKCQSPGLCVAARVERVWVAAGLTVERPASWLRRPCRWPGEDHVRADRRCLERPGQLVVVGPEGPLADGLADRLREAGLPVFGPAAMAPSSSRAAGAKDSLQEACRSIGRLSGPTSREQALDGGRKAMACRWSQPMGWRPARGVPVGRQAWLTTRQAIETFFLKWPPPPPAPFFFQPAGPGAEMAAQRAGVSVLPTRWPHDGACSAGQDHQRIVREILGPEHRRHGAYAFLPPCSMPEWPGRGCGQRLLEPSRAAAPRVEGGADAPRDVLARASSLRILRS